MHDNNTTRFRDSIFSSLKSSHQTAPAEDFISYARNWLDSAGLSYHRQAREALARAHPRLFGRSYEVALRGYERWLAREAAADSLEAFARFVSPRFQRPIA